MENFSRHKDTPNYQTALSRKNRQESTLHEKMLWDVLRGKKLNELKFRRQFPIGRYIVDFYNHPYKLVIEIDGKNHENKKEYDKNMDRYLKSCGFNVIRFSSKEIESDLPGVIKTIITFTTKVPL